MTRDEVEALVQEAQGPISAEKLLKVYNLWRGEIDKRETAEQEVAMLRALGDDVRAFLRDKPPLQWAPYAMPVVVYAWETRARRLLERLRGLT